MPPNSPRRCRGAYGLCAGTWAVSFSISRGTPGVPFVEVALAGGARSTTPGSAAAVLRKILYDGKLLGTGTWAAGRPCVSFTEAPIHEFAAVFSLVELAASKQE